MSAADYTWALLDNADRAHRKSRRLLAATERESRILRVLLDVADSRRPLADAEEIMRELRKPTSPAGPGHPARGALPALGRVG